MSEQVVINPDWSGWPDEVALGAGERPQDTQEIQALRLGLAAMKSRLETSPNVTPLSTDKTPPYPKDVNATVFAGGGLGHAVARMTSARYETM